MKHTRILSIGRSDKLKQNVEKLIIAGYLHLLHRLRQWVSYILHETQTLTKFQKLIQFNKSWRPVNTGSRCHQKIMGTAEGISFILY